MIFVISPSKTMVTRDVKVSLSTPQFLKEAQYLVKLLQTFSLEELQEIYNVSENIAQTNYDRLRNLSKMTPSIFSYTGAQFKALDVISLPKDAVTYLQNNVLILSGMFGLLRPLDSIYLYRLPMETKIQGLSLYDYWGPKVKETLKNEAIVNLASKEYEKVLDLKDLNVTTISFVQFINKKKNISSMELKRMRGLFLRHCAIHKINSLEELKEVTLEGYVFSVRLSSKDTFVYLKQDL